MPGRQFARHYGIGGGSIPIGSGRQPAEVAPAALASTFVTSVAGVITFTTLSLHEHGPVAPDWPTGTALGFGGLAGAYIGARIQSRLPDVLIRRLVGVMVVCHRHLVHVVSPDDLTPHH
jgi:uncharacterized membrane protein YfcA